MMERKLKKVDSLFMAAGQSPSPGQTWDPGLGSTWFPTP